MLVSMSCLFYGFLGSRVSGKQWDTIQRIRANKADYHVGFDELFILWVPGVAGEGEAVGHHAANVRPEAQTQQLLV
jgi:hypothetical protein